MTALPPPLTPPDCDLNTFQYMPLDCARLKRSKTWLICKRRPDLAFYMINLWIAAWHEVPCASLEDDVSTLADLAGVERARWEDVEIDLMRDWVRCSDGRLYHPWLADRANIVWDQRKALAARMDRRLSMASGEWAVLRSEVFKRDNYTCQYCSKRGGRLECDHILPVSKGGDTVASNLATACFVCNRSKGSKTLQEWRLNG